LLALVIILHRDLSPRYWREKTLRECARFANATAAISVLSVGATTGVKNRMLVEQLLNEYEG
ncbi:putative sugar kinase, partial [Salmonella enterica subsp. enterica serovar Enteritidis str. 13183-1]